MTPEGSRWVLPDLERGRAWCRERNGQGIRCILHVLHPYAVNSAQASRCADANRACLDVVADDRLDASLSVKFSSLGSGFDRALSRKTVLALAEAAAERKIGFEIDMEGRGLVEYTVGTAIAAAEAGYPPTLAVQAYLDRSAADLSRLIPHGIRPRIVKGTYGGDTEDFAAVQARFQALAEFLAGRGAAFSAGTHDPDLIRWLQQRFVGSRERVEFGFLLGLADAAKRGLAASGWRVAEYVPFGEAAKGYETRRRRYLETLAAIHREPVP